jgi:hypothetical protein
MTEPAVVIAGGGPTGLMLAGELALGGPRGSDRLLRRSAPSVTGTRRYSVSELRQPGGERPAVNAGYWPPGHAW